jgi:2-polyprenyl-3-methyl-5-hydroxy-6-metoxy-1,4-benzoquinol methylase
MPEYFHTCILCNSEKISPLKKFSSHHLVRCANCGFVFCNRKPTIEELMSIYGYYPIFQEVSPITLKRYDEVLNSLQKFRMTGNLIDIGCGDGYFAERAMKHGWNVFGTEFTDAKVEFNRRKGISMHKGVLDVKNYSPGYFDVIISIEVIEHINNPQEEVVKFSQLLRKGGAVYLTTPNFNSVSKLLLGMNWNIVSFPEHLSYYTQKTLKHLFKRHGFNTESLKSSGISFSRIQQSTNEKSRADEFTYTDETVRQKVESNFFLKVAKGVVNAVLNYFSAGDSLKAVFIKQ